MKIELKTLNISNFKGSGASQNNQFDGNTVISGENGAGKTTVYDAFYWLISDKDSENRAEFGIRPLDSNNNPIEGLITKVQAVISIDGEEVELRKEQHERIVKGSVEGFTNKFWINDVPKKAGEFQNYMLNIITSERLNMLTDLRYFPSTLHHTQRRKVLLDLAGPKAKPEGFKNLLANLQNRTVDEQRSRLREQRKDYSKEREGIPPRLDELNRGIDIFKGDGVNKQLTAVRDRVTNEINAVKKERDKLLAQEEARRKQLAKLNTLHSDLAARERELLSDTSDVSGILDERTKLQTSMMEAMEKIDYYEAQIRKYNIDRTDAQAHLKKKTEEREELRSNTADLKAAKVNVNCYACGRQLPDNRIGELKADKADTIEKLTKQANIAAQQVGKQSKVIEQVDMQVGSAKKMHQESIAKHKALKVESDKELAKINEALDARVQPEPDKDEKWLAIKDKIAAADKAIKPSVEGVIASLENDKEAKNTELIEVNKSLSQTDRIEADKERVSELEGKQRSLSQHIADCDKQLEEIGDYKRAENILLEKQVNNKFKHTTFKLFKELHNGEIVDVCEALYEGKPYPDMSAGEKIYTGIDCANTMAKHYDCFLPLFIDHIESLSLPVQTSCQTIKLLMVKGQKELVIKQEGE